MRTPHLPPVTPRQEQDDAYGKMFKAIEGGKVPAFVERCEETEGNREAIGNTLEGDADMQYVAFDYEEPGIIHRTPAEQRAMETWERTPKTPETASIVQ